ncbi:hypothetical protein [Rhizobium sp. BK376]|uniref:COG3904 family protein n=1 Tax=Rhizobium sp. BK376 TaxID=2512149 RepID=UPI0010EEC036|nr:hypothetical protein [Rhizobium sp. BK376]TCR92092.1 hypothetical protein EV561_102537 [Rhizobium sp. BK376]
MCVAAASLLAVAPLGSVNAEDSPLDRPMEFVLVHGDAAYCDRDGTCADWIAAEGQIKADTPKKLQKILKTVGKKKLPIIVRSPGGDVAAAMEMGLVIRKKGLSVAVGGSRLSGCGFTDPFCTSGRGKDGSATGEVYSSGAVCFSACPLLLAGGVRRIASPFALIGVHQITTTYREERVRYRTEYQMVNGRKKILSQKEIGRKIVGQHDTTKLGKKQKAALIAYLDKMGIDDAIFDMMMSATPSSIRLIKQDEAIQIKMTTEQESADDLVLVNGCADGKTIASCIAALHPAPPTPPPAPVSTPPVLPATDPAPQTPAQPSPSQPVQLPTTGSDEVIL